MKKQSKWLVMFICIIFCCMGCRKTPMQMITNNNFKFWVQSFDSWFEDLKMRETIYYYYDVSGNRKIFRCGRYGFMRDCGVYDVFYREDWRLLNDSTMEEGEKVYRIVKLTPDIMIRKTIKFGYCDTLYAVPDNKVPKEFWRRW